MRLYIAGPMRGLPLYNFPAFDAARDFLRSIGHDPVSPADHDREMGFVEEGVDRMGDTITLEVTPSFSIEAVMRWDLAQVAGADGIVLLPGWEHSTGSAHELAVARACGLRIFELKFNDWYVTPYLAEEQPATIIGMSGYAQSGKDTTGAVLVQEYGFERISFATPLYDMLYALDPPLFFMTDEGLAWYMRDLSVPENNPAGRNVQFVVDTHGWEWTKRNTTVRQLLQRLGTEAGREILGENVWVDTAMAKVKPGGRYVFTDVRFPNEADAIKAAGGQLWRVMRAGRTAVNAHPSETALDGYTFDVGLQNSGSDLASFQNLVRSLADAFVMETA